MSEQDQKETSLLEKDDISFDETALQCFKKCAKYLCENENILYMTTHSSVVPRNSVQLETPFEKCLAFLVFEDVYDVDYDSVVFRMNDFLSKNLLEVIYSNFSSEEENISELLTEYPVSLLSVVTGCPKEYCREIGDALRELIRIRDRHKSTLPLQLIDSTVGNSPLVGEGGLLSISERDALYRFLDSRKQMYVHILLNSCFQLSEHYYYVTKINLNEKELAMIWNSPWLYLLMFNNFQREKLVSFMSSLSESAEEVL